MSDKKNTQQQKAPYLIAGVIVLILVFYGFYVCSNIDNRLQIEKKDENRQKDPSGQAIYGKIITEALADCFQAGMRYENNVAVSCELSGVGFLNNQLLFVSKQDIPGYPSFFMTGYRIPLNLQNRKFLGTEHIRRAKAFQDIAVSPDLNYVFLTTSFEKTPANNESEFINNNLIFYMPANRLDTALIAPGKTNKKRAVYRLRENIRTAMKSKLHPFGPDYFKVEGIAIVSDSSLLLGISKTGNSPTKARPSLLVLEAGYYMAADDRLILTTSFEESYRMDMDAHPKLAKNQYISSLEYDVYNDALYISTSYKNGLRSRDTGGYLWRISMNDFRLHKAPTLIRLAPEIPLHFAHSPSGVSVIDEERLLIICDDDRITGESNIKDPRRDFHRELNQAAYYVLEISP
jgi:hypothetical protein